MIVAPPQKHVTSDKSSKIYYLSLGTSLSIRIGPVEKKFG